jgi:hypothetical protein
MAELLLINPAKRRRATRKTAKRKTRRVTAAAAPARRRRRRNPIGAVRARVMRRPARVARRVRRGRRRNPIMGLSSNSIVTMLKDAAIGGAGAVAVEALMGQVNAYLPASLQKDDTATVGVYDAVKAGITIAAGVALRKPTKGMSTKMAAGALIVQAADIMRKFMPSTMTLGSYGNPARVSQGLRRIGPNSAMIQAGQSGRFFPGHSPLLSMYPGDSAGNSPLLSGDSVREREGNHYR